MSDCVVEIPGWLQFYSTASSEYDEYLKVIANPLVCLASAGKCWSKYRADPAFIEFYFILMVPLGISSAIRIIWIFLETGGVYCIL